MSTSSTSSVQPQAPIAPATVRANDRVNPASTNGVGNTSTTVERVEGENTSWFECLFYPCIFLWKWLSELIWGAETPAEGELSTTAADRVAELKRQIESAQATPQQKVGAFHTLVGLAPDASLTPDNLNATIGEAFALLGDVAERLGYSVYNRYNVYTRSGESLDLSGQVSRGKEMLRNFGAQSRTVREIVTRVMRDFVQDPNSIAVIPAPSSASSALQSTPTNQSSDSEQVEMSRDGTALNKNSSSTRSSLTSQKTVVGNPKSLDSDTLSAIGTKVMTDLKTSQKAAVDKLNLLETNSLLSASVAKMKKVTPREESEYPKTDHLIQLLHKLVKGFSDVGDGVEAKSHAALLLQRLTKEKEANPSELEKGIDAAWNEEITVIANEESVENFIGWFKEHVAPLLPETEKLGGGRTLTAALKKVIAGKSPRNSSSSASNKSPQNKLGGTMRNVKNRVSKTFAKKAKESTTKTDGKSTNSKTAASENSTSSIDTENKEQLQE